MRDTGELELMNDQGLNDALVALRQGASCVRKADHSWDFHHHLAVVNPSLSRIYKRRSC
jgi:hypothetical protein